MTYVPPAGRWESRAPGELGLRADGPPAAIAFHRTHESRWARDFMTASGRFIGVADEPPDSQVLGPVKPRGDLSGVVIRHGYVAAAWGDTARSDMFSIAKSYLSIVAGLAVAGGLIRDLDDPVCDYKLDDAFDSAHNRTITWRHLLQQTSEWQGTMWGKADTIDHHRDLGQSEVGRADKGRARPLTRPGTFWEYNDVRVNRLSLCLLQLFRRPLGDVLREAVMDPLRDQLGLRGLAEVAVVQAADFWNLHDRARRGELDRPAVGCVLVECEMGALDGNRRSNGSGFDAGVVRQGRRPPVRIAGATSLLHS
jgi:Beta-lactamase